ncbi:MAG: trehalose-phosphatase [Candidatus Krumholzibacteriia bacterium]
MKERVAFHAVITDMDGVLTRTASVHQRAWKRLFDDFLSERAGRRGDDGGGERGSGDAQRGERGGGSGDAQRDERGGGSSGRPGENLAPFTDEDYRRHVDGKPRYDGVHDFLVSRGIEMPRGDVNDPPGHTSEYALGLLKNEYFHALLEEQGVEVFPDAVAAVDRWRRGGMALAAISASRNARHVLDASDFTRRFSVIVDGQTAQEEGLHGKADLLRRAAELLDVDPGEAVVLEDAVSGVQAGAEVGFGLVVGVERGDPGEGHARRLSEAGAERVVRDLRSLRFLRLLRDALEHRRSLTEERAGRPLAVFLDFDGTLSPIVEDPGSAGVSQSMREAVAELARHARVAVVSGRDRPDVERRLGLKGLFYAGSHGLDIAGPGHERAHPDAAAAVPHVEDAESALRSALAEVDGVVFERKRFSLAVHYRRVKRASDVERVHAAVAEVLARHAPLRDSPGKKVHELRPDVDWDKGRAVDWLLEALEIDAANTLVLYVGDDTTDEDAFEALTGRGLGIHVGPATSDTLADYRVADPPAVEELLRWLAEKADPRDSDDDTAPS